MEDEAEIKRGQLWSRRPEVVLFSDDRLRILLFVEEPGLFGSRMVRIAPLDDLDDVMVIGSHFLRQKFQLICDVNT